jgi:hypothetical protein
MTCTTEELALLLNLCKYPDASSGILEGSGITRTDDEWNAVMEATIHQLILKKMLVEENLNSDEIPLTAEMFLFIKSYVNSRWMIRCSNPPTQSVLMLHYIENNNWLSHIIDRDIIHEFAYVHENEIPNLISDYYSFDLQNIDLPNEFKLSDESFDSLVTPNNINYIKKSSEFKKQEEESFNLFINDLKNHNWSLFNISFFNIESLYGDPYLENIQFFLPSIKGIWVIEYIEKASKSVLIRRIKINEWAGILENIGKIKFHTK